MKVKTNYIQQILQTEDQHLQKLHGLVAASMKEQELLTQNLQNSQLEVPALGQRIADKVASFGGSWKFIILFAMIIIVWISINILFVKKAFDPFPFILLNLVLSCLAALQAPVIMMSQNRQEQKDRLRADNDYLINLKSEIEIRNLHEKLNLLMEEQLQSLMEIQEYQTKLLEDIKGQARP